MILALKFYEYREHGFELVGEPRVITPDHSEAELLFPIGEDLQVTYRVAITPQLR